MIKNERGQLSILFGTTIVVVISIIAFIINIGYFVKAKINLQNAVDAAAFAGAAVQARQLTNMAYLNWEMRNVYKEWMFKYYVLGNLNTEAVEGSTSPNSNFKMRSSLGALTSDGNDMFNVPSTCIDFKNTNGASICRNYKIPGLPRFESYQVAGMTQTTNAIIDAIEAEKAEDCSNRSALNFATNLLWAYNVVPKTGSTGLQNDAPQIAIDRQGAFPQAFELAIRMRNLEYQINKAPYAQGVCREQNSYNSDFCAIPQQSITSQSLVSNERINKAFESAWRNIGGSDANDILKASFTLKELSPVPFNSNNLKSLSTLLIPQTYEKYYLDLKLITLNYAPFYTAFASGSGNSDLSDTQTGAECEATKIGLPVPGYPLGFTKNPNVLTYYAVKGEANFIGLLNPFEMNTGIKLTAVAAAKPFGGRIGPNLFDLGDNEESMVLPISASSAVFPSSGYILGLDKTGTSSSGVYTRGDPLPDANFWQSNQAQAVGGWLSGDNIRFGIPNLIYDYATSADSPASTFLSSTPIQVIPATPSQANTSVSAGLYNKDILNKFIVNNIDTSDPNGFTPDKISDALISSRAPTTYDYLNYMVPTTESANDELKVNSFGFIPTSSETQRSVGAANSIKDVYNYKIYAPVFSEGGDTLYTNIDQILTVFEEYIQNQDVAIKKYLDSMKKTASGIYNANVSATSDANTGQAAARVIADMPETPINYMRDGPITADDAKVTCSSMAGKFVAFYTGNNNYIRNPETCAGVDRLPTMLREYWANNTDEIGLYYTSSFAEPRNLKEEAYTGYRPQSSHDASNGQFQNSLPGNRPLRNMIRNYYSTKLIPLKSIIPQGFYDASSTLFTIFSDGTSNNTNSSFRQSQFSNPLRKVDIGSDMEQYINH